MKARHLVLSVLMTLGLAGCYTAEKSLIPNDKAVAPYARIVFSEKGSPEDKTVMVREGTAYVGKGEDDSPTMRFMPIGEDFYLAEVTGETDGSITRLYALLKLDVANSVATTYAAVASASDAGPGLASCKREDIDMVCIESVDAYIAHAKALVAAGAEADGTYDIKLE